MRNWLINWLGGVTFDILEERDHWKRCYESVCKNELKLESEVKFRCEQLRVAELRNFELAGERNTFGTERDHLKRANEALHIENAKLTAERDDNHAVYMIALSERDALALKLAKNPPSEYKLDAEVKSRQLGGHGKIVSYSLELVFTPTVGVPKSVVVRSLAASKKAKGELDEIAAQINGM